MRYSIEPRDRRYVKGYGFLSLFLLFTRIKKNMIGTIKYRHCHVTLMYTRIY